MQTFPLTYSQGSQSITFERIGDVGHMPQMPPPCFSLRSRREINAPDQQNSRLVEHWQTDSPALINARRDVQGTSRYMDMNPTASRLYREDMRQNQPFIVPTENLEEQAKMTDYDDQMMVALQKIQKLGTYLAGSLTSELRVRVKAELNTQQEIYKTLIERKRMLSIDSLSRNPYFENYDVQGDTRNIIRELRTTVTEDIVDRGMAESQKLLRRGMENRWLPAHFAEQVDLNPLANSEGLDSVTAYELMKPRINTMEKVYR